MRRTNTILLAAILTVSLITRVDAQLPGTARTIRIDQLLWLQLSDEPGNHMSEGYRHFKAGDRLSAGHSIRKAATFLRIDAANSQPATRRVLGDAAADLQALAAGIEDGTVTRASTLESSFSRAEHALANYQCGYARESWAQKEIRVAGYRMKAAGKSLERAAKWSGEELEAGASAAAEVTQRTGTSIVNGGKYVVDEVGRGLDSLGRGISSFGRRFEQPTP